MNKILQSTLSASRALCAAAIAICLAPAAMADDAYVELTGTQVINTGYHMKLASRIDVDFQLVEKPAAGTRILDAHGGGNYAIYVNGSGHFYYETSVGSSSTGIPSNTHTWDERYTISALRGNNYIYPGASDCNDANDKIAGPFWAGIGDVTLTYPVVIGGWATNTDGTSINGDYPCPKMKVFGVRIYEKVGDAWALICDCKPVVKNGVAGLFDEGANIFMTDTRDGYALASGGGIEAVTRGEDAYIVNTGSDIKGVNSRFFWKPGAKIEVDYALTDATSGSGYRIFGAESSGVGQKMSCYAGSSNISFVQCAEGESASTVGMGGLDTNRHRIGIDATDPASVVCSHITGTTALFATSGGSCANTANHPVGLMGQCKDASGMAFANQAKVRLYRARFWQDGTLVHDYVPCLKGGVAGLKDVAPGGDGAFVTADLLAYGGDIPVEDDDPYIENTTDYIDTGYRATGKTKIVADMACTGTGSTERSGAAYVLFEAYESGGAFLRVYNNWGTFRAICRETGDVWYGWSSVRLGERHEFTIDPRGGEAAVAMVTAGFTNYVTSSASPLVSASTANTSTIKIFSMADGTLNTKARLYGFKIYEDGALVRDYVPAVENGVAGLCDATGNGGFVSGAKTAKTPLISAYGAEEDAYIQATGAQIVNTGYFMNKDSRIAVDFAFTDASTSQRQARLFGQDCNDHESNPRRGTFYISGGDEFAFSSCDAANWNGTGTGVAADVKRHLAVLAISNGSSSYSLSKWDGSAWTTEKSGNLSGIYTTTSTQSMGLFGRPDYADWSAWSCLAKAKIYSVEISEGGVVKHLYYPAKIGGRAGLYDVIGKTFHANAAGGATDFTVGGAGFDHGGKTAPFKVLDPDPASGAANVPCDGATTLTAFAPGAVEYRWEKNGEEIAAPAGLSLSVPWVRQRMPDTFAVTPVFNANGRTVEGSPAEFTVVYNPSAFVLVVR